MLIYQVPHYLLYYVFHAYQPGNAAVFIYHHAKMLVSILHLVKQVVYGLAFGNQKGVSYQAQRFCIMGNRSQSGGVDNVF